MPDRGVKVTRCPPGVASNAMFWGQKVSARYASSVGIDRRGGLTTGVQPELWRRGRRGQRSGVLRFVERDQRALRDREGMMAESQTIDLSQQSGVATVILGPGVDLPADYAYTSRVIPIPATDLTNDPTDILGLLPSQTRIVLVGGQIPRHIFGAFRTAMTRRGLVFVARENEGGLKDALDRVFSKKSMAKREPAPALPVVAKTVGGNGTKNEENGESKRKRGEVTAFVEKFADLRCLSYAEEARRLFPLAQREGVETTLASLAQQLSVLKRKGLSSAGLPPVQCVADPADGVPSGEDEALKTLKILDETLAGLQLVRGVIAAGTNGENARVQALEKENEELKGRLAKLRAALALVEEVNR